jgi:transposase
MEKKMVKKQVVPNRQYTDEFKHEAIRLGESVGMAEACRRLGIPDSSLNNWMRLKRGGKLKEAGTVVALKRGVPELEAENSRLRRELANAKLDLDIVKKAAAYFAKESR